MNDNIISYIEMCRREGTSLQQGMNYALRSNHSVILMSLRRNAPYRDRIEEDGTVLLYEGHDCPKTSDLPNPKQVDQPEHFPSGSLTQNGKFYKASQDFKKGDRLPEQVRVYEKIQPGIWAYNGLFHLIDSWKEFDEARFVFRFRLIAIQECENSESPPRASVMRRRIIPTAVKLAVWKRDRGACVKCGARDELHFDHDLPWSKGGTSLNEGNVQLLCARHNLQKSDQII
jgi:HNH endonuclease